MSLRRAWIVPVIVGIASCLWFVVARDASRTEWPDNVVIISVDTLRADRISGYGYQRNTTPNVDPMIKNGVRFDQARTVEPLTNPALCSMVTSLGPHEHGGSRNGLRLRAGLASLPKALQAQGYRTSAFVGSWTLRHKLSGLAEHFEDYNEVLTRHRWFGMIRSEATADDITDEALDWLQDHMHRDGNPFLMWVHYVEPHAPYRLHKKHLEGLGLAQRSKFPASMRYDTEIAETDSSIGDLMEGLEELGLSEETMVIFTADHGESLGEHGYWGHGRHLYEPSLRIPLVIYWPGKLKPQVVEAPALITDIAPTVLGLLGMPKPAGFGGYDWTDVLQHGQAPPMARVTHYQAHRGAVISNHDSDLRRENGLLELGILQDNRKEIFRIEKRKHWAFDLVEDPQELQSKTPIKGDPSEALQDWMQVVYAGLTQLDTTPVEELDEESIRALRSLGYVD